MVVIGERALRIADVVAVARRRERVALDPALAARMGAARRVIDAAVASDRTVYGVTTGFGALASTRIPPEEAERVQHALLQSHAAGVGPFVEPEVVRAMQVLRARTLATGHCGARPELVERIVALLNAGITPAVPEWGSLGASGDLAPLAHAGIVLTGQGWVLDDSGRAVPAAPVLARAGIEPVRLAATEGLALLNGTEGMLAHLCLALADLEVLLPAADLACAMSVEALRGTDAAYAEPVIALRPHPGALEAAANLRALLAGSSIVASHRHSDHRVQDAYSLRCAPQVHGAARDVVAFARRTVETELASVTDNPVVLPADGSILSTGNFHGQPLAYAADFLTIALADLAAIAERRIDRLMDPSRSEGLPPFLAREAGVNSGFMLAHYTAAALVNRLRGLAAPQSIDSIPTSSGQEDHVSMGWNACRALRHAVEAALAVVAIETVCAAEAIELRGLPPAPATGAAVAALRQVVGRMEADRFLAPDLAAATELVRNGTLVGAASSVCGPLR